MISNVNENYIFYSNDTREPVTREKLILAFDEVKADYIFYSRMAEEIKTLFDVKQDKLNNMKYHSEDLKYISLNLSIAYEVENERYRNERGQLEGIYQVYNDAFEKSEHCKKVLNQIQIIITKK